MYVNECILLQIQTFKNAVLNAVRCHFFSYLWCDFLTSRSMKIPAEWKKMHEIGHKPNHTEEDVHTLIKRDDTLCGHLNARTGSHESKDCSNTPPLNLPSSTLNEYIIFGMSAQKSCRGGEKCEWAEGESDKWAASVALAAVSRPSHNWSHMPAVWSLVYRLKTHPLLPYWSRRHKYTLNLVPMKWNEDN